MEIWIITGNPLSEDRIDNSFGRSQNS